LFFANSFAASSNTFWAWTSKTIYTKRSCRRGSTTLIEPEDN
jgi:hypothetical protein